MQNQQNIIKGFKFKQGIPSEYYLMDGRDVGLKVKIGGKYLKTKNNRDRLFTNLEFSKSIAYINGAKSGRDYEIILYLNGTVIPFEYIQMVNNNLEFFGERDDGQITRFVVSQQYIREFGNFGYIVFDNGDTVRTDKEEGIKRNGILQKIMMQAIDKVAMDVGNVAGVYPWDKGITVEFTHTTSKLDIVTNSGLMDINQWRKGREGEVEEPEYSRCFPFIKSMDKFVTFYTFTSKEMYEPFKVSGSNASAPKTFRNLMIEELKENWGYYNRRDNKYPDPPTFHSVFYKLSNKILSN